MSFDAASIHEWFVCIDAADLSKAGEDGAQAESQEQRDIVRHPNQCVRVVVLPWTMTNDIVRDF